MILGLFVILILSLIVVFLALIYSRVDDIAKRLKEARKDDK
jgi:hypothetical protein